MYSFNSDIEILNQYSKLVKQIFPFFNSDEAYLRVESRDMNTSKQDIWDLKMTFYFPYFLEYPSNGNIVISASVEPSTIQINTGLLVLQVR